MSPHHFIWFVGIFATTSAVWAQTPGAGAEVGDLREDVRGLSQRVGELTLRIEQLEHDNAQLKSRVKTQGSDDVTTAQLNAAIAELSAAIQSATAASKKETLELVAAQMEKLGRQTNAAIDSLAKATDQPRSSAAVAKVAPVAPVTKGAAEASYPKEGISYTVQKGDYLSLIAKKTGGKSQDIIAANKLSDPSKIQVGQVLFIPGGK